MWYSLIDGRSSCIAITHLAWGTLEDIANDLINECNMLIDTMTDGMDEDEIEEEYGDDIAEFKEFEDSDTHISVDYNSAHSRITTEERERLLRNIANTRFCVSNERLEGLLELKKRFEEKMNSSNDNWEV